MKITYKIKFFNRAASSSIIIDHLPTVEEVRYHPLRYDCTTVNIFRLIDGEIDNEDSDPMMRLYFRGQVIYKGQFDYFKHDSSIKKYGACLLLRYKIDTDLDADIFDENNKPVGRTCWFNPKTDKRV